MDSYESFNKPENIGHKIINFINKTYPCMIFYLINLQIIILGLILYMINKFNKCN